MEDFERCGNDLRFILQWLHHHGDPRSSTLVATLAEITQNLSAVLVSSGLTNAALAREYKAESLKSLSQAVNKLGSANIATAA